MNKLRWPFLILALIVAAVIVLIERAEFDPNRITPYIPRFLRGTETLEPDDLFTLFDDAQQAELDDLKAEKEDEAAERITTDLEGLGVPALMWIDASFLFSLALITIGVVMPPSWQAKLQGCATLIFAILLILGAIVAALAALAKVLTMIALLLAFPFGTIVYFFRYADFDRGAAATFLTLLFSLKLLAGILLILAHQRFIENKGLVVIFIVSLIGNIVVAFLHGLVPGFLVSITDGISAIVVAVIGIIVAIILAIGAIISLIMVLIGLVGSASSVATAPVSP